MKKSKTILLKVGSEEPVGNVPSEQEVKPIYTTIGERSTQIPVSISYKILELFSGGLYSSPTKAIEELVANSFDAMASWVYVITSRNMDSNDSLIAVVDNGDSMDTVGLQNLWRIGESNKSKLLEKNTQKRLPIGKFGIGKLATWVLARQLTYICKQGKKYIAVTMFYSSLDNHQTAESTTLNLDVRELSIDEVRTALKPLEGNEFDSRILFNKQIDSWTVTILSSLKPMVNDLKIGRLEWVLSTAMPITPDFRCYLNNKEIKSSKLDAEPLNRWIIGENDQVAENLEFEISKQKTGPKDERFGVNLPILGRVTGYVEIYEDTLTKGKSADWGRSHGFFIMVMKRLINLQDELFGIHPLSHRTFNRFRMVVFCNGLNDFLLSSREGVAEKDATDELKTYLTKKFYEAETWYENWLNKENDQKLLSARLGKIPRGLLKRPIVEMVVRAVAGNIPHPRLTKLPTGLTAEENETFVADLIKSAESDSQKEFVNDVVFEPLGVDYPIAVFDAMNNKITINNLHPFYINYQEYFRNPEPFQVIGIAEILTEAQLYSMDMHPEDINDLLSKRDNFLRELVYSSDRLSAPLVAQMLKDAAGDDKGLENALAKAFRSLGFDVIPMGKPGEPDGLATANLGVRQDVNGIARYSIAYDAKSTKNNTVKTGNVNSAGLTRHRIKYKADYAVVVGKKFSDERDEESAVIEEARQQTKTTLITIEDFARLIETAATKRLGLHKLRDLFETCVSPEESRSWIDKFISEEVPIPPIPEILDAIYSLQTTTNESVQIAEIKWQSERLNKLSKPEIKAWLQSIAALVPEYVSIIGDVVELQMSPERVLSEIGIVLKKERSSPTRNALLKSLDEDNFRKRKPTKK